MSTEDDSDPIYGSDTEMPNRKKAMQIIKLEREITNISKSLKRQSQADIKRKVARIHKLFKENDTRFIGNLLAELSNMAADPTLYPPRPREEYRQWIRECHPH